MSRAPEGRNKGEVVANALHEKRAQFRSFVRARVPADEVDDVLQLAAMRAVERAESLVDLTRVEPWLYRLHRNVIADVSRERARSRKVIVPSARLSESSAAAAPEASSVEETCACSLSQGRRLHAPYAAILHLVDVGELSLGEAAEALGISVNNATVRLHRARKALRKQLLEHCGVKSLRDCLDCRCVYEGCCAA